MCWLDTIIHCLLEKVLTSLSEAEHQIRIIHGEYNYNTTMIIILSTKKYNEIQCSAMFEVMCVVTW